MIVRVFSVNNTSIDSLAQSTGGMGTSTTTLATAGTATSFQRQASSSSQNAVQVLDRSIRAYFFEAIKAISCQWHSLSHVTLQLSWLLIADESLPLLGESECLLYRLLPLCRQYHLLVES